ncbi:DUF2975 domain-containing protein [Undibacterium sp. Di27W]|uniref:DUF2975 domain-containing protein n=1 Tax=Undibacterium sp. Di27W TaxID=3413036 RepID=UPI003BEF9969
MQVQKHARITNIRKLSKYFLFLTVLAMALVAVGGITLTAIIVCSSTGDLTVPAYLAKAAALGSRIAPFLMDGLSVELKVLAVLGCIFFFGMIEMVLMHIKQLLTCFQQGEIFNKQAVFHAKRAFNINFAFVAIMFLVELLSTAVSYVYPWNGMTGNLEGFFFKSFDQIVWLCICLLLLWSLEIGVDLNEEAELTI